MKRKILATRAVGSTRSSLANPAQKILKLYHRYDMIALLGVGFRGIDDMSILYGYFVEPAFRCGCTLLIISDIKPAQWGQLSQVQDPFWRYPWTLERLQHLMDLGSVPSEIKSQPPESWWQHMLRKLTPWGDASEVSGQTTTLDPQQNAAVFSGDGVVQVIAPAGSGKTTVLIERVKELQRRGTAPERILCMSFNRDAKVEIGQRLIRAGVEGVVVRSFHGMGLAILKAENCLPGSIGSLDDAALEKIITKAMAKAGDQSHSINEKFTAQDARNEISGFKLSAMISADKAVFQAQQQSPVKRMVACVYKLYQQELKRQKLLDFDDLVANAIALLQTNKAVRKRWQFKFERLLVDEYQDIEPSQALLVGILAAPQDSLFCVGDEDQCIYAWRRATVQRIIELDQIYPGLERHTLIRNYRCARTITTASRKLIQNNRVRFNKPLLSGAKIKGEITRASFVSRHAGATIAARLIYGSDPQEVVVLARTSRLLEEVRSAYDRLWGKAPPVELSTIHAAKGREWDRVILFGVDEGQTPHSQAKTEEDVEDERRLFYVALTRAKKQLDIISTKNRESRFLREAGLG